MKVKVKFLGMFELPHGQGEALRAEKAGGL